MKNSSLVYLLPILGSASSPAAAELPNMQEGLWEVTTKVEISGQAKALPEYTVQHCLTKKDIEEGKGKLYQPDSRNSKCQVKNYKVEGNKASWSIACSGDNPTTGSGSVTYSGTGFAGMTKMKMGKQDQETEMTQTFSGKRIGVCKQ
ncbi:MAG: DUF3617 domain-containing protein [Burkholderiales bacterium]